MSTKELLSETFEELQRDEEMTVSGGYCAIYKALSAVYNFFGLSCNLGTSGPSTYVPTSGRCTAR